VAGAKDPDKAGHLISAIEQNNPDQLKSALQRQRSWFFKPKITYENKVFAESEQNRAPSP
jgi:hypothetical protein